MNDHGGVNGHPINYSIVDSANSPSTSAQVATRLVDQTKVAAIVGSDDLYACTTSNKLFQSSGTFVLDGLGIDPACWQTPNDTPVNNGPFFGYVVSAYFLAKVLHKSSLCAMVANISNARAIDNNVFKVIHTIIGQTVKQILYTPGQDLTPVVTQTAADGCKALIMVGNTATFTSMMKTAQLQGHTNGQITWMGLTTGYTQQAQQDLANVKGYWVNSEMLPWSLSSSDLTQYKALQKKYKFSLDSSAECGYLAAKVFVEALKTIKGPITRTSVGNALKGLKDASTFGLTGKPFTWGVYNLSSMFLQLKAGKWIPYGGPQGKWYHVPATKAEVHSVVSGQPLK